ncbi:SGNH/GDSL hydrolase family protein [Hyalangium versicolor]|uniref:SGNH/GDSL hydrolase family protein n=1 Tax=Hyalangium versicolor TaxID=2861190 RepID=UPI001CCDFFE9|nr:SGNH/GDSL hydrolase family protein [Hyalangium versicolor]
MHSLSLTVGLVLHLGDAGGAVVHVSPYAPELRFSGRVDRKDRHGPRLAWSGTRFEVRFTGDSVQVRLRDLPKIPDLRGRIWPNRFQVKLDDQPPQQVFVKEGSDVLFQQSGLPKGPHRLEVYKQTEAMVGEAQLLGIDLAPGAQVLPPEPMPSRRIELFGDSITAGYGNEGQDSSCHFSPETENHDLSYGELTAHALGAEAVTIAWSGRGVVRNVEAPKDAPVLPLMFDRTLPARGGSRWDFASWTPDAVVVNLGANDFASGDPGRERFEKAYEAFLVRLRARYPNAFLVVALGPTLSDSWPAGVQARAKARSYLNAVVLRRQTAGDSRTSFLEFAPQDPANGYGCDYHPNLVTHRAMAELLTARLRSLLGW